jgi:VIT1/CCC1 family predicted Fe2+/Mn2+ transporter
MSRQAFEFGCSDDDMERSSIKASLVSGGLFILGSLPAVVPFACTNKRDDAVIAALVCCLVMLFVVGAAKTKVTRSNPWFGGFENMLFGAAGSAGIVSRLALLICYLFCNDMLNPLQFRTELEPYMSMLRLL